MCSSVDSFALHAFRLALIYFRWRWCHST